MCAREINLSGDPTPEQYLHTCLACGKMWASFLRYAPCCSLACYMAMVQAGQGWWGGEWRQWGIADACA